MTHVLMSGRKDERLFLCPPPSPGSYCSDASAVFTLKHMVIGQQKYHGTKVFSAAQKKMAS